MIEINETVKLSVNHSDYIMKNNNPSTITIYSSNLNNQSILDLEKTDKLNNKLTFSGHFYIRNNGEIYRGRPINALGEFAYNNDNSIDLNYDNIGVCIEGNFDTDFLSDIQKFALFSLFDYLKEEITPNIKMVYLRELDLKYDPGILFPYSDVTRYFYDTFPIGRTLIGNLKYDAFNSRELWYDYTSLMYGTDIYAIQVLLKKLGFYEGLLNGSFDNSTRIAVNNYQISRDLVGSGMAGFKTLERMNEDIKKLYTTKAFVRVLEKDTGDEELQGVDVLALQKELNNKRYYCKETGMYDLETVNCIKQFQLANNIDVDGKVGPITWSLIFNNDVNINFRILKLVSSDIMYGSDVKLLQERLCELGYRLPITEKYDFLTESQVRRYQIINNFEPNGIVNKELWNYIFSEI